MKPKSRRERGSQAAATLDHGAGALQADSWRGFRGKRPREARSAGGGGRSASTPQLPPALRAAQATAAAEAQRRWRRRSSLPAAEGSTDNKSPEEKRRAEEANLAHNSVTPRARCRASPRRGSPGTREAAGGSEGPCAPAAAGDAGVGGCGSLRRELAAQGLAVRGLKPGVLPEWGPPRRSGSVHRCLDWQARRRAPALGCGSLLSPPPLLFFPPPFPTTPAAAASKC